MYGIDEHPDWKISPIIENELYLGAREGAEDEITIYDYKIKSILSICTLPVAVPSQVTEWKIIEFDDDPNETISSCFDEAFKFLNNCKKPVLVHCEAGMSRSATIVIGWLMSKGKTLKEAYTFVKERRTLISPNNGFLHQLYQYSEKLYPNDEGTILMLFNFFANRGEKENEDIETAKKFVSGFSKCKFNWALFWNNYKSLGL